MARRKPRRYFIGDAGGTITATELRRADRDTQLEVMRDWFYQNYADPVENTPYESAEGGYIFIWGGPYDAHEELESEFSGVVPDELIEELGDELSKIAAEWTSHAHEPDIDDYFVDAMVGLPDRAYAPRAGLLDIQDLLTVNVGELLQQRFLQMLYANVITMLETYLSDLFTTAIMTDRALFRKFVETNPEFREQKIRLSEVLEVSEQIDQMVKGHLTDLVWHKLDRVKEMFSAVLGVDFPKDMSELFKAIVVRHDIVHRSGKTKDGTDHVLTAADVTKLIETVDAFVSEIDGQCNRRNPVPPPEPPGPLHS